MPSRSQPAVSLPAPPPFLYVGIKGHVVALRRDGGAIAWSTKLEKGSSLVPIAVEGDRLYALSNGEATCLDARTGKVIWHNPLKGFGTGYAMLAGAQDPGAAVAAIYAAAAAAAAASAAT